jgi:hypothetical protein
MTDFICVYFGHDSANPDKWWNINAKGFASAKQAESHGKFMMPTAGVFGFAVIRELEDEWEVIDNFSMLPPKVSISCDRLGIFNIQPASQFQTV